MLHPMMRLFLFWAKPVLKTGTRHAKDSNPGSRSCDPSASLLSRPTEECIDHDCNFSYTKSIMGLNTVEALRNFVFEPKEKKIHNIHVTDIVIGLWGQQNLIRFYLSKSFFWVKKNLIQWTQFKESTPRNSSNLSHAIDACMCSV